jgi:hypothetical protein
MSHGRHDEGKPHRPHKTKGHHHKGGHHPSHAKHNKAHGLPHDMFAHDGDDYGSGGSKGGFCAAGNCSHS